MSLATSLYKITDVMQVPVNVKSGTVSGVRTGTVSLGSGIVFPLTMEAVTMFKGEQVGVLFHVAADLQILVSHYEKSGAISMYLLDKSKFSVSLKTLIKPNANLREVVETLRPAIAKVFHWSDNRWKTLTLPSAPL